jgi:hypothetical protein
LAPAGFFVLFGRGFSSSFYSGYANPTNLLFLAGPPRLTGSVTSSFFPNGLSSFFPNGSANFFFSATSAGFSSFFPNGLSSFLPKGLSLLALARGFAGSSFISNEIVFFSTGLTSAGLIAAFVGSGVF